MRNTFSPVLMPIAMLLLFVFSSCGYRLTPVGGVIPEGAKTIAIPVFLNNTNEPYVDTVLTQDVVNEFLSDGRLKVVDLEDGDIILRCKILKFDLTPVAYTADPYVQTYNVSIVISFSLEDAKTRKMLVPETNLNSAFISSYPVTLGNISETKIVREAAIKKASRDIAPTVRSRVLEGF
jgi:hypothetical protein